MQTPDEYCVPIGRLILICVNVVLQGHFQNYLSVNVVKFYLLPVLIMVNSTYYLVLNNVHENQQTRRTFPMARHKCLMSDFTNLNRIYKAHRTNVWWIMKVFRVHWSWSDQIQCVQGAMWLEILYEFCGPAKIHCCNVRTSIAVNHRLLVPWSISGLWKISYYSITFWLSERI